MLEGFKMEIAGFKSIEDAKALLESAGDQYVIMRVSEGKLGGEAIAYIVVLKDLNPI